MKKSLCTLALIASIGVLTSCNDTTTKNEEQIDTTAAAANGATPAPVPATTLSDGDKKFAEEAAIGSMLEVKLGQLAAASGASEDVKKFGQKMVEDHGNASADLQAIAASKNLTLPTTLPADKQKMVDDLTALKGADFDKKYVPMMVDDHENDLKAFNNESATGQDAEMKAFATNTAKVISVHYDMIKGIKAKMK